MMALQERISVVKWFLIFLFLSTLFTLILISGLDGQQKQYCLSKYLQTVDTKTSSWVDYAEHWNGEILIYTNSTKKEIVFTDEYQIRMISKGLHPLSMKHEHYHKRIERMEKYCNAFPSASEGRYDFSQGRYALVFNDEAKLLQCRIPKISSFTWLYIFINMIDYNITSNSSFKLHEYPKWDRISLLYNSTDQRLVAKRFQTYTKFLITRNPFERLVSAHRDKFTQNNLPYEDKHAPKIIIANYLSHLEQEFIETMRSNLKRGITNLTVGLEESVLQQIKRLDAGVGNYSITFAEFLNYIIISIAESGRESLDYHWAPMTIVCNPCTVRYDFIGKFDTLYEDSQVVLDYAQTDLPHNKVQFPKGDPVVTKDSCNEAFLNIPRVIRNKLYQLYKEDFILFDYPYNGENPNNKFC